MRLEIDEVTQTIAFQCRNCGACCGPIPFTNEDKKRIEAYLLKVDIDELERMFNWKSNPKRDLLTCIFRDEEKKKCAIHPVRPEICKMQGYYEGLSCPHQPQFATRSREEGRKRLEAIK